jgi:hypothetical protein
MLRRAHDGCTSGGEVEARGATDTAVGIGDEDDTATEGVMEAEGVDKRVGVVAFCEGRFVAPHHCLDRRLLKCSLKFDRLPFTAPRPRSAKNLKRALDPGDHLLCPHCERRGIKLQDS